MTGSPLRVAVWGAGPHAEKRLLPALAQGGPVALAGVTTRDAERGARLAAASGCRFWPSPDDLLASDEVDAVMVATPIGLHAEHGRAVLSAGKHLFCEKSLTATLADALALAAEAERRRLVLAEGFMFLHHPHWRDLQAAAAGLGDLVSLTSRFTMPHLERPGFRASRALGGGGLLDVGCYPARAAVALLGGELDVVHARLVSAPGHEVDSMGSAVLGAPAGATALLEWGFGAAYRNELTLCGTAGSLDADRVFSKLPDHVPELVLRDARGTARTVPSRAADPFTLMFADFAAATRDDAHRRALAAEAVAQARLLDAIRRAA